MSELYWADSRIPPTDNLLHLIAIRGENGSMEFNYGFYQDNQWHYIRLMDKEVVCYTKESFSLEQLNRVLRENWIKE